MRFLPSERPQGSEAVLGGWEKRFLLACLLIAGVTLGIGFHLYPKVNPEASIRFVVDRSQSKGAAVGFLKKIGIEVGGYRHAARFTYDNAAKVFLERSLGPEKANGLMSGSVRMWRWGNRWFRPLQKEEVDVEVATTGQIASFSHPIPEDAAGADLPVEQARALAEQFLTGPLGVDLAGLEFQDVRTEHRPHRTDHTFTWKRSGVDWNGGDYRFEVLIQGDKPGGYREYVRIPEAWSRDYARLRSKNVGANMVSSILFVLTAIGVVVILLLRIRGRDVRWRTAGIIGGVGAVLVILVGLNSFPNTLYNYDTTASFTGFLILQLGQIVMSGLLAGAGFFLLTAGSEPVYRSVFPEKMSLTGLFSRRGIRTRRFLLMNALGLTMTCVFFCYQEVFYTVAKRLGAWAPMDVPYDELLNTAVPWVFVLFFGFFPAVMEEFMSRMFSISFLKRYVRLTWLAVILPAFIWGFGHAGYPNQPFYIRGVEVGVAGVFIGLIMLRTSILATLVWHYTVDALYTSYLLFRSGNVYYIVSAAVAGGLLLLPLIYASVAYLRTRRFEEPIGLRNGDERGAETPVVPGPAPAAEAEVRPARDRVWSGRRRLTALAVTAVSLLLLLVPSTDLKGVLSARLGKPEARAAAGNVLRSLGVSPDSFQVAMVAELNSGDQVPRYILDHAGVDRLREEYTRWLPPFRWKVRYFRPLDPHELSVRLDGGSGRLLVLERRVAEKDSIPSVPQDSAQSLARSFLRGQGLDLTALDLKEASQVKRPHRLDDTFIWEARPGDPRNVGEARHRVRVLVQGNQIGEYEQFLKLPEDWVREQEKRNAAVSLRMILTVVAAGAILGLLLWLLIEGHRDGRILWRRVLVWSIPVALLALLNVFNSWPTVLQRYDTSVPWNVFLLTIVVGAVGGIVVGYLGAALALAWATVSWPEAWSLRKPVFRRPLWGDALLASIAALAAGLALGHLKGSLLHLWPKLSSPPGLPAPAGVSLAVPWFGVFFRVIRSTLVGLGLIGGTLGLLRLRKGHRDLTALLLILLIVAAVPVDARTAGAFLVGLLESAVAVAVSLGIAALFDRNILAWPVCFWIGVSASAVEPYLRADGSYFRTQGWIAAVILAIPLAWAALASLSRAGEGQ